MLQRSARPEGIEENADTYDFELAEEETKVLETGKYEPSSQDSTVTPLDY